MRVEKRETIYLEYHEEQVVEEFYNLMRNLSHETEEEELNDLCVDIKNYVEELMGYMKGDY